ncbi:MAG: hypothetical protein ACJ738_02895 [Gaiellales bacterium]
MSIRIESDLDWVDELLTEGAAGQLEPSALQDGRPLLLRIEAEGRPFSRRGWEIVTRGVWRHGCETIFENVCATGFDLHLEVSGGTAAFTYRWLPAARARVMRVALGSRFHLLVRAALMQYPALWWAGTSDRAPLHASGIESRTCAALVTAAGGVGRSTLLLDELSRGNRVTGDNLGVSDGRRLWGLVEPVRVARAGGRRMPHGRSEMPMAGRVPELEPSCVVTLERGDHGGHPYLVPSSPEAAARALVTSTYMAGELRRYWAFAATLAASTGIGPAQSPVEAAASTLTANLPCWSLRLGRPGDRPLSDLLSEEEVNACIS